MYPSNAEICITGSYDQLQFALNAIFKLYGIQDIFNQTNNLRKYPAQIGFMKIEPDRAPGKYRLGIVYDNPDNPNKNWTIFPFKYDLDILSKIILQWLKDQTHAVNERDPILNYDGSVEKGFKITPGTHDDDYRIICDIEPFLCFYAK